LKFVSGSEDLKSADVALKAADFKMTLPADGDPHILRRGLLFCGATSGCSLTLFNPTEVQSLN
jgi:hypothetical protein